MTQKIRKLVLPVAGLGTRFLPATKAVPKELLPVVDKPLIQYAVEEGLEAGIRHFIFVTGRGKGAIEDFYDHAYELESALRDKDKHAELALLEATALEPGAMSFVRQMAPLGLGHAVWCARDIVGDEPFAVILPDELLSARPGCLAQMAAAYERIGGNLVATVDVPRDQTGRYGIVDPGSADGQLTEVRGLIEKPAPGDAPSTLAIIGRYVLTPEIFEALSRQQRGAGNEIQLTDAMAALIGRQPFHAHQFDGVRFDCGDKAGFIAANLAFALARPDIEPQLRALLDDLPEVPADKPDA